MAHFEDLEDGRTRKERAAFFKAVYDRAGGDADQVPWTNDTAKPEVLEWLKANPAKNGSRALDIACGLGENAEALRAAGYDTVAFDVSEKAIDWAQKRYPDSKVSFHVADLFNLPAAWGQFDLVHECYTLQSFPDEMRPDVFKAIARMVAPGGNLIVYARVRPDGTSWDSVPWPVMHGEFERFEQHGLTLVEESLFDAPGSKGQTIPHSFKVYKKD